MNYLKQILTVSYTVNNQNVYLANAALDFLDNLYQDEEHKNNINEIIEAGYMDKEFMLTKKGVFKIAPIVFKNYFEVASRKINTLIPMLSNVIDSLEYKLLKAKEFDLIESSPLYNLLVKAHRVIEEILANTIAPEKT
tara:strand:- start:667 stop:1080 length:414 start_codon:yes stop_codon:yes gene_type:complete